MGGGNGQKAKMARERNLEKQKGNKGSQLEANKKAMNIQAVIGYLNYNTTSGSVLDHVFASTVVCDCSETIKPGRIQRMGLWVSSRVDIGDTSTGQYLPTFGF